MSFRSMCFAEAVAPADCQRRASATAPPVGTEGPASIAATASCVFAAPAGKETPVQWVSFWADVPGSIGCIANLS